MNFFKRLFSKAAITFARAFSFFPEFTRYAFTAISARMLVRDGYKKNAVVSACSTTLQLTFPEPPLIAGYEEEGRSIPNYKHPINTLLKRPNPDMGMAEFMQFVITYAPIGGNCYIWKQRSQSGKVVALWPFSDLQFTPIAGHNVLEGFVSHYEYDAGDGTIIPISKNDVIHWKWMIDPENPWKGIGAVELSAREVDRDTEATSYIFSLLKNNAVPPVVITLEEGDEPTQEEKDAMGRKWVAKHSRGEPAFITSGMKVDQMGFDLNKLAAETLADIPETRIAANFKVPPSVAGLNVGVKRSDYGDTAARKAFTEQTLMALWRSLASELLNGLRDDFNETNDFTLWFDIRNVGALQEQKKDQWLRVVDAFNRGLLTRTQAKQELGMKPDAGDDVYLISLATEFVSARGDGVVDRSANDVQKVYTRYVEEKSKRSGMRSVGRNLQKIRMQTARRMEGDVDAYFSQLSDRVVERAGKSKKSDLPNPDDLITGDDSKKLEALIKKYYVEIIQLSWNTWNHTLGVEINFELTDPIVTAALESAAYQVKKITDTTMEEIRNVLKYGNENGWSVDQLVRGDDNQPGLRDIVEETYKDRASVIARTELGEAQNNATAARYGAAGVELVEILDNGSTDDDEECKQANGQIWTLDYFSNHVLEHPNCTRAAVPYFGDGKPDQG
jgi:HK97 family phage portal protein